MNDLSLFDAPTQGPRIVGEPAAGSYRTARVERDAAIARVDDAADEGWKEAAYGFLVEYLRTHRSMFVDDLWTAGLPTTREDRALGAVFQKAVRAGLMCKSGEYRKSVRSHLSEKPVWSSLVFAEVA